MTTFYRHYKGGLYVIKARAKHSETLEDMVVYMNTKTAEMWCRPAAMFFGEVEEGRPRFKETTSGEILAKGGVLPECERGEST